MNDATSPGLDLGAAASGASYRVLARKYRPATFADLIGQEAMVRTISNAFETGRIPQAWILTGVRGVGKTTTARILARALNYELPDGSVKGPTIHMPVLGLHDQAIMDSRHVDIIEMDAASHNGVDDVRQINEAVRYSPVSARYKVYILDEVHMLSGAAFNALLKTLEEPPPHVKFVFATTEIRKVPITVLSRCQRFDLRRVDAAALVKHLDAICAKENISAEPEALALIARAAEGSVRDALSLMDQAIAHAAGAVRAEDIRQMLGLADRTRVIDLFEALMRGDMAKALGELRDQYDSGADPAVVLSDLAEFTNFVTRVKIVPAVADDPSLAEAERTRGRTFAAQLSMRVLSRTWQMLFKGLTEMKDAGKPLAAGRDGAGAHRLCGRLADAGRSHPRYPEQRCGIARAGQWRQYCTGRARAALRAAARGSPRLACASSAGQRPGAGYCDHAHRRDRADRPERCELSGIDRAREREARHPDEDGARTRRAARAPGGRQARSRARADRAQGAGERSRAQADRVDRQALDGRGLGRAGRADRELSGAGEEDRAGAGRARRSVGTEGACALSRRRDRRRHAARRRGRTFERRAAGEPGRLRRG
jgi:DNA polymerase III subunit gamma/tau